MILRKITVFFIVIIFGFISCGRKNYWSEMEKMEIGHIWKSINYYQTIVKEANKSAPYSEISKDEIQNTIQLLKNCLYEATFVSDAVLDKLLPEFKMNFRQKFQKGVQLYLEGLQNDDNKKLLSGQILIDEWGSWYINHMLDIEKSIKK